MPEGRLERTRRAYEDEILDPPFVDLPAAYSFCGVTDEELRALVDEHDEPGYGAGV